MLFKQIALLILTSFVSTQAWSASIDKVSFGGRLTDDNGAPLTDTKVDMNVTIYNTSSTTGIAGYWLPNTPLTNGYFNVFLIEGRDVPNITTLLTTSDDLYAEVWAGKPQEAGKPKDPGKTYPRQLITAVPFARKVPVDGTTITYNTDGKLQAVSQNASNMPACPRNSAWGLDTDNPNNKAKTFSARATYKMAYDENRNPICVVDRYTVHTVPQSQSTVGLTGVVSLPIINELCGSTRCKIWIGNGDDEVHQYLGLGFYSGDTFSISENTNPTISENTNPTIDNTRTHKIKFKDRTQDINYNFSYCKLTDQAYINGAGGLAGNGFGNIWDTNSDGSGYQKALGTSDSDKDMAYGSLFIATTNLSKRWCILTIER